MKVAIAGVCGRMGSSIYHCLSESAFDDCQLSVATASNQHSSLGKTIQSVLGGDSQVVIDESLSTDFDVLIDFTTVSSTLENIKYCVTHQKAIVIGTTGFSQQDIDFINQQAEYIPIFRSANMSVGVNIIEQLVAIAAKALHQQADIEVVEAHHKHKVDAPSGTALMLGQSIADAIGIDLAEKGVFAREGITGEREPGSIGFSTIRGGDVVGEHTAYFYMAGERVEISHRATDRKIFARGALFAANYLSQQGNGLYNMFNALQLDN